MTKCGRFSKEQCQEADYLVKKWMKDFDEAKKDPKKFKKKYYTKEEIKEKFKHLKEEKK